MEEQVIRDLIQEAWNEGDSNSKDKFGDFLNRAAKKVCALLSPEGEKPPIIDEGEQLTCSLISKYPYREVKDVIHEACVHQRDADLLYTTKPKG